MRRGIYMKIIGTGSALPAYTLTNEKLTEFLDTSDEWIVTRTGIHTRQVITDETLLQLGTDAAKRALDSAGVSGADIDFIFCTTLQGDTATPSLACLLQKEIGAACPAIDMNGACAGFIYALDMADAYFRAGKAQRILIVSAEAMSRMVDWTDRATCVLFGDGAGAVVLEAGGRFVSRLTSAGNAVPLNIQPYIGNSPFIKEPVPARLLYMDGPEIYKFAVSHSSADLKAVAGDAGLSLDDISYFILHQANKRILDAVRVRLKQPDEKFLMNIQKRGNMSSACIPVLIDEERRAGRFVPGDILALSAFGAGLTTGAAILEWAM